MAFILTYNSLINDVIPPYLERTDPSTLAQIPSFVSQAQERIGNDLKTLGLNTYLVGNFITALSTYAKPTLWRNTLNFNFGSGTNFNTMNALELRSYDFCRNYWPDPTEIGVPKYYADYGWDNWLVVPTPDDNYPFEISFNGLPQTIDASQQTNWVTRFAPRLLINACLLEAQKFVKNPNMYQLWEKEYTQDIQTLLKEDKNRLTDEYSQRNKG